MNRQRVTFQVSVNLDPTPGTFHTTISAQENITHILNSMIGHYNPVVEFVSVRDTGSDAERDDRLYLWRRSHDGHICAPTLESMILCDHIDAMAYDFDRDMGMYDN